MIVRFYDRQKWGTRPITESEVLDAAQPVFQQPKQVALGAEFLFDASRGQVDRVPQAGRRRHPPPEAAHPGQPETFQTKKNEENPHSHRSLHDLRTRNGAISGIHSQSSVKTSFKINEEM